ncbi:MAG: DUF1778 domain-containing protein [Proteobacteria bacterium]|nr:DUF1778 domain-containing protein [Pseudomonadota bacterium]
MAERLRRRKASLATQTISLRASPEQKALIDRAAAVLGKSRTEFMLESARDAAENALLDRRLFLLDEARYKEFADVLDAPVVPGDELRRLLATPPPWER